MFKKEPPAVAFISEISMNIREHALFQSCRGFLLQNSTLLVVPRVNHWLKEYQVSDKINEFLVVIFKQVVCAPLKKITKGKQC